MSVPTTAPRSRRAADRPSRRLPDTVHDGARTYRLVRAWPRGTEHALVELAADGRIVEPRSGLGLYLVRHWELVSLVNGESLVYWLRKLVFRGAWLDHRVKEGLLDVAFENATGDFGYAEPKGGRTLLELAPVPSWREHQYRA